MIPDRFDWSAVLAAVNPLMGVGRFAPLTAAVRGAWGRVGRGGGALGWLGCSVLPSADQPDFDLKIGKIVPGFIGRQRRDIKTLGEGEAGAIGKGESAPFGDRPQPSDRNAVSRRHRFDRQGSFGAFGLAKLGGRRGRVATSLGYLRQHLGQVHHADRGALGDRVGDDPAALLVVEERQGC